MHYLALVGGGLVAIGCFLPWIQLGTLFIQRGIDNPDGSIALVVACLTMGVALFNIAKKRNEYKFVYPLAGVVCLGIGIFDLMEIKKRINQMGEFFQLVQGFLGLQGDTEVLFNIMGMGVWIVGIGGVLLIVASFLKSSHEVGVKTPVPNGMVAEGISTGSNSTRKEAPFDKNALLFGMTGPYAGQQIPVPAEGLVMGRDPSSCSLVIQSQTVSRTHARLSPGPAPDSWILEDLNSTNGTFVMDKASWVKVSAPVTLTIFKRFRLGDGGNEFEIR